MNPRISAGICQPLSEASSVLLAWDPLTNWDVGWLTLASGEGKEVVARLQYRDFSLRLEGWQGLESEVNREVELKDKDLEHSSQIERTRRPSHTDVGSQEIIIRNPKNNLKLTGIGGKPQSCDKCGKSFSLAKYLQRHKQRHTRTHELIQNEEKHIECDILCTSFSTAVTLRRH